MLLDFCRASGIRTKFKAMCFVCVCEVERDEDDLLSFSMYFFLLFTLQKPDQIIVFLTPAHSGVGKLCLDPCPVLLHLQTLLSLLKIPSQTVFVSYFRAEKRSVAF